MTPLQKIGMGMVIVLLPANFPRNPHPAWAFYDALPDPVGWAFVIAGVWALGVHLDVDIAKWFAVVAFVVSVPLWFPQVNHLLAPEYNRHIQVSFQWFVALPQALFGLFLSRTLGQAGIAQTPRDTLVAGRFGLLTWAFGALVLLPVIAYGGGVKALQSPTLLAIGLVNLVFVYYLFRVHRRTWLGGPGPLEFHPRPAERAGPDE